MHTQVCVYELTMTKYHLCSKKNLHPLSCFDAAFFNLKLWIIKVGEFYMLRRPFLAYPVTYSINRASGNITHNSEGYSTQLNRLTRDDNCTVLGRSCQNHWIRFVINLPKLHLANIKNLTIATGHGDFGLSLTFTCFCEVRTLDLLISIHYIIKILSQKWQNLSLNQYCRMCVCACILIEYC